MSEALTWAFTGGVVGSLVTALLHSWAYDRMVAMFQAEMMRLVTNHHQVVTGLIERLNEDAP